VALYIGALMQLPCLCRFELCLHHCVGSAVRGARSRKASLHSSLSPFGRAKYTSGRHVIAMALMPTCAGLFFAGTIDACTVQGISTGDLLPGFTAVLGEYLHQTTTPSHGTLCCM
jgi:hypothetical protein